MTHFGCTEAACDLFFRLSKTFLQIHQKKLKIFLFFSLGIIDFALDSLQM